jgi:hypothetical protein
MAATPGSFDYWNRGEPLALASKSATGGFDYWNRGEVFGLCAAPASGGTAYPRGMSSLRPAALRTIDLYRYLD